MNTVIDTATPASSTNDEAPMAAAEKPGVGRDLITQLVGQARDQGVAIDGENGLLAELTKLVVEAALEGEMSEHLGYDKHARGDSDNARNGIRTKTVQTKGGPIQIDVPRDRDSSFEPVVVKKRQRRLGSIEDVVLSLSARGMTHGDIAAHLADVYGTEVSKTTISTITDRVLDGMQEWQNRPLDPVYPVMFIDAIHMKVRDGQVSNRPIYVALAVCCQSTPGLKAAPIISSKRCRVSSSGMSSSIQDSGSHQLPSVFRIRGSSGATSGRLVAYFASLTRSAEKGNRSLVR